MKLLSRPWGAMHYRIDGNPSGQTLVFANSLGTDLRLWDAVLPALSAYRVIRFDKRGHGLSDFGGAYSIADLAADAAALIEETCDGPVIFVGLSIGGMIGQSLAAERPELVKALVISNSAHAMGTAESWLTRIATVEAKGIAAIGSAVMERWFGPTFRATPQLTLWQNMLERTLPAGYIEACRAIAGENLEATTRTLALPVQVIVGSEDGASPPDLVRSTADMIAGARFAIIEGAGHLPPVETPSEMVQILQDFIKDIA